MVGFAFIDNTDLFLASKTTATTGEDMVSEFQKALNRWSDGLIAKMARCPLSNPSATLSPSRGTGMNGSTDPWRAKFTLMDKNSNRDSLCRHDVHYVEKTLSVCISMKRIEEAEMTHMKDHSNIFADQIITSKCSKNAALYTHNSSFMKTMRYVMPVTYFSEIEWNHIPSPRTIARESP